MNQIKVGTKTIGYSVEYRERKTLGIKVMPDSSVVVVAPVHANQPEIQKKVKEKGRWILQQQSFFDSFQPGTPSRQFISGETHLYLGRQYKLRIEKGPANAVKLYRGQLVVSSANTKDVQQLLNEWYRERAKTVISDLFSQLLLNHKAFSKYAPILRIQKMNNRWGSCTPTGKIIINSELIKAPKVCIEYILLHELCHLAYPNHNKKFYNYLSTYMSDWSDVKNRLEKIMS